MEKTSNPNFLNICITGAAGNVARLFLNLLCSGDVFEDTHFNLTFLDLKEKRNTLEGLLLELEDSGYVHLEKVTIADSEPEAFTNMDLVIFLGGASRKPGLIFNYVLTFIGMERIDLININA